MKQLKRGMLVTSIVLILTLAVGCGSEGGTATGTNPNNVEDVLQAQMDEADGKNLETTEVETETTTLPPSPAKAENPEIYTTEGVDLDLTQLSGTLLYAQVSYMMYKPEEFLGKTVKVPGNFSAVYSEEDQRYYFGCLVRDQAACCVLGVEFELPEDYVYPDDYPAEGEEITVFGTFDTYEQGPYTYAVLRGATMVG